MDSVSSTFSDSSKTGSSSSKRWSDDAKEPDLTDDNAASPVDLECFIQTERITKLLEQAVYKTKLALCLPLLMREQRTLAKYLNPQDLQEVSFIFDQYDNPLFSTSLMNMAVMEEIQNGDVTLENRLNPELGHLLYTVNSSKGLRHNIELMIQKIKADANKPRVRKSNIPVGLDYLLQLEKFRDLMVTRMTTTAAQQLTATFETRKQEASNRNLLEKIKQYKTTLAEENEEFQKVMAEKKTVTAKLELECRRLRQASDATLHKRIIDSERQMVVQTRAHLVRAEMFKEVEVESREVYDRVLRKDVLDETNNRLRRRKVETQLLSWIQKYDSEMQEKQNEIDEITGIYDEETALVKKLENQLEEQDKIFVPLMEERDAEYQEEMTVKMNNFLAEHAARVIQIAWRDTLANRAEKKKLRKLLKQKQAAEAAAARLAEAEAKKAAAAAKQEAIAAKKAEKAAAKEAKAAAKEAKAAAPKETKEDSEKKEATEAQEADD